MKRTTVLSATLAAVAAVSQFGAYATVPSGPFDTLLVKTSKRTVWRLGPNNFAEPGEASAAPRTTSAAMSPGKLATPVAAARNEAAETETETPTSGSGVVAAGDRHSLVAVPDAQVWAFGSNYYGELGDGTQTHRYVPGPVNTLTGIIALSAGTSNSAAVRSDNTLCEAATAA